MAEAADYEDLVAQLVGRRVAGVDLDDVRDGYIVLVLDDGTSLEIRTSKVGHLLLSRRPA